MPVVCRLARMEDLERADQIVVASINELTERRGFGQMASSHPPNFQAFSLRDDAEGLWAADDDGEIIGFAWSWVCGELWFLAQLFVSPDRQSDGIGNQLLGKAFAHAQMRGASIKALITFAFNNVSQGLYISHGLFPRCPIYMVSVPRDRLALRLAEPRFHLEPLTAKTARFDELARIDVSARRLQRETSSISAGRQRDERVHHPRWQRVRGVCLYFRRAHWPACSRLSRRNGRRICCGVIIRGAEQRSNDFGFLAGCERASPQGGDRPRDAHHVPDAADVEPTIRKLEQLSSAQSGVHVVRRN